MRTLLFLATFVVALTAAGPQQPTFSERGACAGAVRPVRFGCANAANLRPMLADPADTVRGRTPTPTMGALDAAAIERLRTDKVKPFVGTGANDSFKTAGPR